MTLLSKLVASLGFPYLATGCADALRVGDVIRFEHDRRAHIVIAPAGADWQIMRVRP